MNFFKRLFGIIEVILPVVSRDNEPDVYYIQTEEERMNFAMEKARLTLAYFKTSLANPARYQHYFSLKCRITDGIHTEHIWLKNVSHDESNNFFGIIGNEPMNITTVKLGQQIGLSGDDVSDWMIIEQGRLIGGYTIRAIRDGQSAAQQKELDRSIGIIIDEGVDYFEHTLATPEGAILCLEDAYDKKDIDEAIACKDFEAEASLMLSRVRGIKQLARNPRMIAHTAETLRQSFINHLLQHGFPSFDGIERAFPHRQYVNDNLCIVTEVCYHPDGSKSKNRLYVSRTGDEWRVLNNVS